MRGRFRQLQRRSPRWVRSATRNQRTLHRLERLHTVRRRPNLRSGIERVGRVRMPMTRDLDSRARGPVRLSVGVLTALLVAGIWPGCTFETAPLEGDCREGMKWCADAK